MSFSRPGRFAVLLVCCWPAIGIAGCGDSTAEVSGTITLRGKPPNLKGLDIGFMSGNGRLVTAPVNPDGTYKAAGVPVGKVMVSLIYTSPAAAQNKGKPHLHRPGSPASPAPNPGGQQVDNPIPQDLRDGSTSKLSLKVVSGRNNVFNYDVQP